MNTDQQIIFWALIQVWALANVFGTGVLIVCEILTGRETR
jgi:hypothetical protein